MKLQGIVTEYLPKIKQAIHKLSSFAQNPEDLEPFIEARDHIYAAHSLISGALGKQNGGSLKDFKERKQLFTSRFLTENSIAESALAIHCKN